MHLFDAYVVSGASYALCFKTFYVPSFDSHSFKKKRVILFIVLYS